MTVIGTGNTGAKLALSFDDNAILFSTAHQDSMNFIGKNIVTVSERGASKKFSEGIRIWNEKYDKLVENLDYIKNDNVIIFSALGGGSGSASLYPISNILIENNNKILIVGILPFKREINPPLANAVQAINSLMPIIAHVSVIIFDNEKLIKEYESDWNKINAYIIRRVDYMINLLKKYNTEGYSPLTLDQSELESVVFGGGFIDISEDFLEERLPRFIYSRLDKTTKNCLSVMFVDNAIKTMEKVEFYHGIFTNVIKRLAGRAANARMIPGILRAEINYTNAEDESIKDRAYVTIASGLSIDRYLKRIERLRDEAVKRASIFGEKMKGTRIVKGRDKKILDI